MQAVSDEDIAAIELDVSGKMVDRIQSGDTFHASDFFASETSPFKFSAGDTKTIKQLGIYVQRIINENGYQYFNKKSRNCSQISSFSFGIMGEKK